MSIITLGTRIELEWVPFDPVTRKPVQPRNFRLFARIKGPGGREVELTDWTMNGNAIVASWKPPAVGVWTARLEVSDPFELVYQGNEDIFVRAT